jgi:hypothetical protein
MSTWEKNDVTKYFSSMMDGCMLHYYVPFHHWIPRSNSGFLPILGALSPTLIRTKIGDQTLVRTKIGDQILGRWLGSEVMKNRPWKLGQLFLTRVIFYQTMPYLCTCV